MDQGPTVILLVIPRGAYFSPFSHSQKDSEALSHLLKH